MSNLAYIKHKDIDFKKWDETILHSEFPTVFAQSYYLNATSPGWDALVINNYESIFPLTWKNKLGITYLPQPYFTSQLGAFGKVNPQIEKEFRDFIEKKYKLIEIELNVSNQLDSTYNRPKNTFVIKYANQFKYNQNTTRNIAKARASGLVVKQVPDLEILDLSEKLLNPFLLEELKLPKNEVAKFGSLLVNCMENHSLLTFKTVNETNEIKAMGHFVFNKRYALFLKGTTIDKQDNSGSMHILISYAIDYFKDKCEIFDFGGGSLNAGLAGFYKGLGGTQLNYYFLRINNLNPLLKLLKK
ncbi:hypothetical protein CNR22_19425 [Sphingobacteriaceae bacterium]|nr:hypothetical protein CNR22_19425 [Sphingobacteriaceae bacterium]